MGRLVLAGLAFVLVVTVMGIVAAAPPQPSPIWDRISDEIVERCAIEDRMPSGRCMNHPQSEPRIEASPPVFGPRPCPVEDRMPSGRCLDASTETAPSITMAPLEPVGPPPPRLGDCAIEDRLPSGRCPSVAAQ